MAPPRHRPRDGSTWIIGILMLSLVVLVALAWQAFDAERRHRDAARDVLRDYARLAADELAARCHQAVGYYGALPALQQLVLHSERATAPGLIAPERLGPRGDRQLREALALFDTTIRFDPASGTLETAGQPLEPPVADWLRQRLADGVERQVDGQSMAAVQTVIGGVEHRFLVTPPRLATSPIYGLALDHEALGTRLGARLTARSLLPASIAAEDLGADAVAIELHDAAGRWIFATARLPSVRLYDDTPVVTHAFGDAYLGLLDGWTARVALDPDSAPKLVIGGLPRSRLPMIAGLIGLGVLLLATAMIQLRRARRLTRLRADFVAEVSHELRTPLTQIRMFTETLLLGRVRSADESRRSLQIIDRETRRLSRLVENILQFARRERGALVLERRAQTLAPVVRAVIDDMTPMAAASATRFVAELDEQAFARVDAAACKQVLINLLDNALKYGPEGQTVRIRLTTDGDRIRLTVEDEGPGVPPSERERVFESYRRLDRDRRAAIAGTGIGLAVVRDLVARHDGEVAVHAGTGGGARFTVTLPAAESAGSSASAAPVRRDAPTAEVAP